MQLQDMDIDEEPTGITDQLSMFYSEIQDQEPAIVPAPIPAKEYSPCYLAGPEDTASSSAPSSAPASPAPAEPATSKRRKKVKVSNNIALKKKGVGDMLAKWQKISE